MANSKLKLEEEEAWRQIAGHLYLLGVKGNEKEELLILIADWGTKQIALKNDKDD